MLPSSLLSRVVPGSERRCLTLFAGHPRAKFPGHFAWGVRARGPRVAWPLVQSWAFRLNGTPMYGMDTGA
eukprot:8297583-Lingulodinium_polyedra.AAC.1